MQNSTNRSIADTGIQLFLALTNGGRVVKKVARGCSFLSFETRVKYDLFYKPQYGYCTYHAALVAKALGIEKISIIEFGVSAGRGLLEMEKIAAEATRVTGVEIEVYGFDTGQGMPESANPYDLPYVWKKGFFKMDVPKLKSSLKNAELIIGNVAETVKSFAETRNPAPIGFISFDLDYYSSTVSAFSIFDSPDEYFLPRVFCYFDDCIGDDWELHSEFAGELLAIREFNDSRTDMKLGELYGLSHKRKIPSAWNNEVFVLHRFEHPLYTKHIHPAKDW